VRRLLVLVAAAAAAWWLIGRRRGSADDSAATIGYADGSAVTFEQGSSELDRLLHIAAGAKAG
jgi:hypothetical protein